MAIIEMKRNEKYKIETFIGYNKDGKKIRIYETFDGKKSEAKIRDMELKKKAKKGTLIDNNNLTFEQLADIWFKNYANTNLEEKTIEGYNSMILIINKSIGSYKINKIKPIMLEEFYNSLRKREEDKKQLSENTILHYYVFISAIFNKAIKWQLADVNPNKSINRPKLVKKQARFYDVEQVRLLLEKVDNESLKYQSLIRLAIDSGARAGEILGLEWEDINFKTGSISITKTIISTNNDGIKEKDKPKNNSSIRNIPITAETLSTLKLFKEEQAQLKDKLGNKWLNCKKVFTSDLGGYMHTSTPNHILQKIINKHGLPATICFHSLRHSSASLQIALGIHMKTISKRLGHANSSTTDMIYSHISSSLDDEVVNKMNMLFNTKKDS
ncbi:MAG: tyrosine-type recombinase/integrase [Ignavibacteriales bacterium]